jgi:hypothetical protein
MRRRVFLLAVLLCACSSEPTWSSWAGDPESTRYSPLAQIDADNFSRLQVSWTWVSTDVEWKRKLVERARTEKLSFSFNEIVDIAEFQATPIFVDGVLYGVTAAGHVFALDAGTGVERWVYDTGAYQSSQGFWDFLWPKQRASPGGKGAVPADLRRLPVGARREDRQADRELRQGRSHRPDGGIARPADPAARGVLPDFAGRGGG